MTSSTFFNFPFPLEQMRKPLPHTKRAVGRRDRVSEYQGGSMERVVGLYLISH